MLTIEPDRSALLVMDVQVEVVARVGERAVAVLESAAAAVTAARKAHLPIIYVVVGFRPGYPEVSPRNLALAAVAQNGRFVVTTPGADIAAPVRPDPADIIIVKHRLSAFAGTDLDMILRARGIDTLVLLGLATGGVVLSTVRHAADADYRIVVLKDGCADWDDEVHRVLTEKIFVRQATVVSVGDFTAALAGVTP